MTRTRSRSESWAAPSSEELDWDLQTGHIVGIEQEYNDPGMYTVEARKLEDDCPTPKPREEGRPAKMILNVYFNCGSPMCSYHIPTIFFSRLPLFGSLFPGGVGHLC